MRRRVAITAVVAALAAAPTAVAADAPPLVPRELASLTSESHALLGLSEAASPAVERRLRRSGAALISKRLRIWRIRSGAARRLVPPLAVAGALRDAEPDAWHTRAGHFAAGDPLIPRQWWVDRIGASRAEPPAVGKPVAVIDLGLDVSHEEFAQRPNTTPLNEQAFGRREFHGTAVASIVAAPANGVGLVGVYPEAALMSWDAGSTFGIPTSEVIAGIGAAVERGAAVVNLSLGGESRSRLEEEAILDAVARGLLIVAAAGNERDAGNPPSYPASLPHVLTVAGTNGFDQVSAFSSRVPGIDVAAPAESIPIAVPTFVSRTGYASNEGTSFAAPLVAGAAAWIWTVRPELDATQVTEILRRSARDVGPPGRDPDTGFGVIDIPAALALPAPPPDPGEPNDSIRQTRPAVLFPSGGAPLTTRRRGSGAVTARLDSVDDPADVYRVWVPPRARVRATTPAASRVAVTLAGSDVRVRRAGSGGASLELTSLSSRGGYVYVRASLAGATEATYRLTISTTRPRR